MKFTRDMFQPDWTAVDPARLCDRLWSGRWLVEADSQPPAAHQPEVLLADRDGQGGMAVTLRSATLLRLNLGPALVERLDAEGCAIAQLAALALHEVVLNAVIHGNFAVESGPSVAWEQLAARQHLIDAALKDAERAARLVTVALGWDAASVSAVIADQGSGYCAAAHVSPVGRRGAGRGLTIARAAARVEVLNGGRCTRLVFERCGAAAAD